MKKTTFELARIRVVDNGYDISFSKGEGYSTEKYKVAHTLQEVRQILDDNLNDLVDVNNE